ncbi:MAG: CAP domain-containing protein [Pirellulaceae bacterium]
MSTWSLVTVLACAHLAAIPQDGALATRQRLLHEHPTLVSMFEQSNALRRQYGLPDQRVSPYLTQIAQRHAEWMANTGSFAHNYQHPYPEIIYWNARSIPDAFQGWMNSGPHRSIILSGTQSVGYGYAVGPNGQTYWCGVFASIQEPATVGADGT